jgi:hypothetical protein
MSLFRAKRWQDLTETQQIAIVVMGVIQVGLVGAALVDIYRRSEEELTASKGAWTAITFVNFFGPIAYFLFGRRE